VETNKNEHRAICMWLSNNVYQTHLFLYSVLSSSTLLIQIKVVSEQSFEENICTPQERK
jgi:hypothetical protein